MKPITVLSLFDGMSCGQIALDRLQIPVKTYFASEIKKSAIQVTKHNFPNTTHIGDITKITFADGTLHTENGSFAIGEIDLVIGGSPCQDFSIARTSAGLKCDNLQGVKSRLFYEYLQLVNEIKPKYFLLENVKMNKKSKAELDAYLGVEGLYIDSSLVSFQTRARYYWTNIPNVTVPEDRGVNFQDYKDTNLEYCDLFKVNPTPSRLRMWNNGLGRTDLKSCKNVTNSKKVGALTRKQDRAPNSGLIEHRDFCRYLTKRELELAQTVPVGYTDCLSYNQAQDVLGDGWTIDTIAHILINIKY